MIGRTVCVALPNGTKWRAYTSESVKTGWLASLILWPQMSEVGVICGDADTGSPVEVNWVQPYESVETTKYGTIWRYASFKWVAIKPEDSNSMLLVKPECAEERLRELFNEYFWQKAEAGL